MGGSTTITTKRIVSEALDIDNNSNGHPVNATDYSTAVVHSFTDDFYQYQVIKIPFQNIF